MDRHLLAVDGLVAGYTGPVVGPVSFQILAGEIVGLNGPNGVGKSTVLAGITGTARRFAGEVRCKPGLRVAHHRQRPERPREIPLRGTELASLAGADAGAAPALLVAQLARPVDELSGGQYQFLQTWLCMAGPADLVLLDEPTNNLDGTGIELLTQMLADFAPHRGVLLVSHETEFLRRTCTRLLDIGQ